MRIEHHFNCWRSGSRSKPNQREADFMEDERRLGTSVVHPGTATTNVASRVGLTISGEHLTGAATDRRSLAIVSRHIQRKTPDDILLQQLEFPSSAAGLQRDSGARAGQLSDFAKYSQIIIKLCQLDLREEDLGSRIETVALAQLTELQDARTDLAFSDCLQSAQTRLV